jgi:glycerol uptake facilitator-like aquaporin
VNAFAVWMLELAGALLFALFGSIVTSVTGAIDSESINCTRILGIALVEAFLFYVLIFVVMKLSLGRSGYFNPAITIALCILDCFYDRRRERGSRVWTFLSRALFLVLAQFIGASIGSLLAVNLVPGALAGVEKGGIATPNLGMSGAHALLLETVLLVFLVSMVLSVRVHEDRNSSMMLFFAFLAARAIAFPFTGSSLNLARQFGQALAGNHMAYVYIGFASTGIGAVVAAAAFIVLQANK